MDDFSSALQHLSSVHTAQLRALTERLEEEQRARRELEEKIEALKKANDEARKSVEHAKKKIRQQAKQIRELEKKLQNNGQEEDTPGSCAEPSIPAVAEGVVRLDWPSEVITDAHKLNQTCATLFESPALVVNGSKVDGSKVGVSDETPVRPVSYSTRLREDPLQKVSGDQGERERGDDTVDYHRGESIETVAEDVIILDDDAIGNNDPAPAHSSSSKSAVIDPALDQEKTKQNESMNSEDLSTSLPPSGPVHVVYSHARTYTSHIRPFGEESDQSPKRTHLSRPLSLRDAGANKVKWKEVSSSNTASTSASNLSDTKPPPSPDRTASPSDDSEGTSATSSPEQSSPSLLCASNSPWKLQQSNSSSSRQQQSSSTSTPVNMTHSLFARTPAAGPSGSVVMTTPVSMLKSAIPQSDSQFSLDVSQSAPLSPELGPLITPVQKPQLLPNTTPASSARLKPPSTDLPICISNNPVHSVDRSVVPITPGVRSVNKILNGRKRWMIPGQSPALENTAATVHVADEQTSARKANGKRGQEQVDFEDEDILPHSKVYRLNDTAASSHAMDDDHTRLEYEPVVDSSSEEEGDSPMSPGLLNPRHTATVTMAARSNDSTSSVTVQGQTANNQLSSKSSPWKHDQQWILERAGLPTGYKFEIPIRKKADRDKLDGKACPDCQAWFAKDDGIHGDVQDHLKQTCRHKHLHLPPDEDSKIWNISFPNTEECENIMNRR